MDKGRGHAQTPKEIRWDLGPYRCFCSGSPDPAAEWEEEMAPPYLLTDPTSLVPPVEVVICIYAYIYVLNCMFIYAYLCIFIYVN